MARHAQVPVPVLADIRRAPHNRGGGSMRWSYIPRWKFTDSCGRPSVPGALHLGCAHDAHAECHHATRREFLEAGVAIAGAAGFATVVDPREVFAQVRVFPPPPPEVSPIAGLMDTHVHAAPDVFGRSMDDEEVAILYKERGLEALVLKNHVVATADRAWFARKHVAGIKVFGADGKVLPAVRDVLKICAEQKLVVHTGHLSPTEALAVIEAGRDAGVSRLVVTHAQFEVVNMSLEQMEKAASMGAKLELCAMGTLMGPEAHLAWMRHWRRVKVEETAAAVKQLGAQNFVLATDLGQTGNPSPADGLQLFVTDLMKAGVSKDDVTKMGREVTGSLLMG